MKNLVWRLPLLLSVAVSLLSSGCKLTDSDAAKSAPLKIGAAEIDVVQGIRFDQLFFAGSGVKKFKPS